MSIALYDGIDALPSRLRLYGASDFATMEPEPGKKEPDFTEHGVWGMDVIGDLWAVDWWSGQVETDEGIKAMISLFARYKPLRWWHEGGLIDKAIKPAIRDAMRRAQSFVAIEPMPKLEDKAIKLQAFHARATSGTVHFPIKRQWAENCIEQLVKFPGGRWDDKADVCGLIGRGVDQMYPAHVPVADSRPQLVPFTEQWLEWTPNKGKPKVRYF